MVIKNLKKVRLLLFPFGIIYGLIMAIRNMLFDIGIFVSRTSSIKSIGIGNLSMGGTGKSVVVMHILKILKDSRTATLSRGYGRKSSGLIIAGPNDNHFSLGDEPYQFLNRYPHTTVVVSEKRIHGIEAIEKMLPPPNFVVLDDVMQHRWVHPQLIIMTSSFQHPYFGDFIFPVGKLREFRKGVKRADIILITGAPEDLSVDRKEIFLKNITVDTPVFFTKICYADVLTQHEKTIDSKVLSEEGFLLVTGIANTHHLVAHLKKHYGEFEHLEFKDHHFYSPSDIQLINNRAGEKIILTTEKDFAKLAQNIPNNRLYCLTIELDFVFEEESSLFEKTIRAL